MDCNRARIGILRLGAALALCQSAIAAAPVPELRAARWLAPETRARALNERPAECYMPPADPAVRASAETGRAAFRTPLLLGGQAARAGLSCESCHRAGRGNPDFLFAGLSGAPGTADVTSSLMSSHRGNQVFDPRPIPDLAMPGKVSRAPADPALRNFIRGLVVEEFDGAEPSSRVLDGLAAYVRALDTTACGRDQTAVVVLRDQRDDIARARTAALVALAADDAATARLMIAAMRTALGQIDERYAVKGLGAHRDALRTADRELLAIQQALHRDQGDAASQLRGWRNPAEAAAFVRDEPRSLYNSAVLRRLYSAPEAAARRP